MLLVNIVGKNYFGHEIEIENFEPTTTLYDVGRDILRHFGYVMAHFSFANDFKVIRLHVDETETPSNPPNAYQFSCGGAMNLTCQIIEPKKSMSYRQEAGFVDVEKTEALIQTEWSRTAPRWRRASQGLTLEGTCKNQQCEAYNKMVIYNHGFQEFDLISDNPYCPICQQQFTAIKPGFNNCKWRILGVKASPKGSVSQFIVNWKTVGDIYETYDEKMAKSSEYESLSIQVRKSTPGSTLCSICQKIQHPQNSPEVRPFKCEHVFHSACIPAWREVHPQCPICSRS